MLYFNRGHGKIDRGTPVIVVHCRSWISPEWACVSVSFLKRKLCSPLERQINGDWLLLNICITRQ
ncbi:MAG: hypothetical protein AAF208_02515 [Cyanobacteria bacterium P01_A01_bin.45]